MPKQKFHRGDRVRIGRMPPSMFHFQGECEALVIGSYVDLWHAHVNSPKDLDLYKKYELMVLQDNGTGRSSAWYYEDQLTPIPGPHGKRVLNSFMRVPFG